VILPARQEKSGKPTYVEPINICGISAVAFQNNLKQKDNTFFTTSLYKINQLIRDQALSKQDPNNQRLGEAKL
jgi:hypothetical protein